MRQPISDIDFEDFMVAYVMDNDDPKGEGRVAVWIPKIMPHFGIYENTEIKDEKLNKRSIINDNSESFISSFAEKIQTCNYIWVDPIKNWYPRLHPHDDKWKSRGKNHEHKLPDGKKPYIKHTHDGPGDPGYNHPDLTHHLNAEFDSNTKVNQSGEFKIDNTQTANLSIQSASVGDHGSHSHSGTVVPDIDGKGNLTGSQKEEGKANLIIKKTGFYREISNTSYHMIPREHDEILVMFLSGDPKKGYYLPFVL
jgi:hypothetical protein